MSDKTKKVFKSSTMKSAHELASALFRSGDISKEKMKEFDRACVKPSKGVEVK